MNFNNIKHDIGYQFWRFKRTRVGVYIINLIKKFKQKRCKHKFEIYWRGDWDVSKLGKYTRRTSTTLCKERYLPSDIKVIICTKCNLIDNTKEEKPKTLADIRDEKLEKLLRRR